MKTLLWFLGVICVGLCLAQPLIAQITIHNWNFNTPPSPGPQWQSPLAASTGSGVLTHAFLDSIVSFTGSTLNGEPGDPDGGSFCPKSTLNNLQSFTLAVPTTGYVSPVFSYATRGTSTGYTTHEVSYSLDGSTFFVIQTFTGRNVTSWSVLSVDFGSISGANNNANFKIRITIDGCTGASGNNRFDNVKLQGYSPTANDGDGTASITNATVGLLSGSKIFHRNASGTSVTVTIIGVPSGALDKVKLTVPGTWGSYSSANVSVGGAFAGNTPVFSGNDIQINSAALGTTPGTITITSLTSANPVGALVDGNDTWIVQTAATGGTLTTIAIPPVSRTIIPISNMRTGGVDGYGNKDAAGDTSAMIGKTIAIGGIATMPNGILNTTSYSNFYLQAGDYGVQIFRSGALATTFSRGDSIILEGLVGAFNGCTQVTPPTTLSPYFFVVGPGTLPAPLVLTNASSITEQYEGRLVKLMSATFDSAGVAPNFIASTSNRGANTFRTSPSDTGCPFLHVANTAVVGKLIPPSADIVGIVHQRNDIMGLGQTRHKLAVRDLVDVGVDPTDGSGTAAISPASQLVGSTPVTETLVLKGNGTNTIAGMSLTLPSSWTWTGNSVHAVLSGPGFTSATKVISGSGTVGDPWVVTVNSAAVTLIDSGIVTVSSLTVPATPEVAQFTVKTRGSTGTLSNITNQPVVNVVLPSYEAFQSGNWSSTSVWAGGIVPGPADNVTMTTLNVVVSIDIPNAQCNNLTMTGSGSASNSGPVLQFAASGASGLTVNGDLSISGGSGGGGGDRGGRPQLTSNGNTSALLILKGNLSTSASNSTANGNAGLNMNEGTAKINGTGTCTATIGAGWRMGGLEIGDGTNAKTFTIVTNTSNTLAVSSITVKQGSTINIGSATNTNASAIGSTASGVVKLTNGITIESGATMQLQNFSGGYNANINIDTTCSIANNGTMVLRSADCSYALNVGFSGGTATGSHAIGGSNAGTFANIIIANGHTLTLNQDVSIPNTANKLTISSGGTLVETPGNTVIGILEATRTLSTGVNEAFGGIGVEINAVGAAPGSTLARRVSGRVPGLPSNPHMLRYFDITPTTNSGLNATFVLMYDDSELVGATESTLELLKSTDGGTSWTAHGGTVNTTANTITVTGMNEFSRWTGASATTVNVGVLLGWSLQCNPVTRVVGADSVRQLYPTSLNPYAFAYVAGLGYVQRYTMPNRVGYWVKYGAAGSQDIAGYHRGIDAIPVIMGWNLVGGISCTVDTSTITPVGLRASNWWGYGSSGYFAATQIVPGKGYWIKANANSAFVMTCPTTLAAKAEPVKPVEEEFNTITITDADGNSQTLLFGPDANGKVLVAMYEMPPAPPEGSFDARFETELGGFMLQTHAAAVTDPIELPIALQASAYPLTITWKIAAAEPGQTSYTYELSDGLEGRAFGKQTLRGEGTMTMGNESVTRFVLVAKNGEQLPTEYALYQNYPNPFNPTTTITFALPKAGLVTLKVFDLLGREVATLVNETRPAGYHDVQLDAGSISSGIYFYRLQANEFVATSKMMLLK